LAFEQVTDEAFGRALMATTLHQNINHIAILIDGTPQLLVLFLKRDKHFVDVPHIA
jgi:hypothetical protein